MVVVEVARMVVVIFVVAGVCDNVDGAVNISHIN